MKNKNVNIIIALCLILAVFSATSCDMFTSSLFKNQARDLSSTMKNVSTENLIDSGSNPDVVGNPESAKAALEALGEREDLENISPEQATNVCNLASSAILPISNLMGIVDQLMNQTTPPDQDEEDFEENVPSDPENGETTENDSQQMLNMFTEILDTVPVVDTTAIETVLNNENLVKEADITSVTMATISLMATAIKEEVSKNEAPIEETTQELLNQISENMEKLQNDETFSPENLSNATAEEKKELISTILKDSPLEDNTAIQTAVFSFLTLSGREDFDVIGNLLGFGSEEEPSNDSEQ